MSGLISSRLADTQASSLSQVHTWLTTRSAEPLGHTPMKPVLDAFVLPLLVHIKENLSCDAKQYTELNKILILKC